MPHTDPVRQWNRQIRNRCQFGRLSTRKREGKPTSCVQCIDTNLACGQRCMQNFQLHPPKSIIYTVNYMGTLAHTHQHTHTDTHTNKHTCVYSHTWLTFYLELAFKCCPLPVDCLLSPFACYQMLH